MASNGGVCSRMAAARHIHSDLRQGRLTETGVPIPVMSTGLAFNGILNELKRGKTVSLQQHGLHWLARRARCHCARSGQ
jgi:hypothetical protein